MANLWSFVERGREHLGATSWRRLRGTKRDDVYALTNLSGRLPKGKFPVVPQFEI